MLVTAGVGSTVSDEIGVCGGASVAVMLGVQVKNGASVTAGDGLPTARVDMGVGVIACAAINAQPISGATVA